jgi:squalene synthase HpnC
VRNEGTRTLPSDTPAAQDLRAREHHENFPVALRLLPGRYRDALHAVYGFARTVDELGDSHSGDRTAALQAFDTDLHRIWSADASGPTHPVLRRLQPVVHQHDLPLDPFLHLVQANLQDQRVTRYPTFADLLGYCRLSADPVGRIVLGVFGIGPDADPEAVRLSDRVCTALQLLEHWQDVGEDRRAGRVYLPQEDLRAYGVAETDLDRREATPALRSLMRFETDRAAAILAEGAGLVDRLDGWARISVAGFLAGGQATVAALRRTRGDVLAQAATPSRPGTAARALRLLAVRPGRREGRGTGR